MKPKIRIVKTEASPQPAPGDAGEPAAAITLAEQAHRSLRRDIISGAIPAGQPLRLEYLKARYGISFSPLREALNRLHSERLVVSTPSRGFRVAPFSEAEMWDAIETRIVIDCEALRRSLARGDDGWEARLVASFEALMQGAPGARTPDAGPPDGPAADAPAQGAPMPDAGAEALEARHQDFHRSLIGACGSRWLLDLSGQLYAQTERYRQPSLRHRPQARFGRDVGLEHRQLLDAAVARDAGLAAGLLARHYRETGRMVRQALRAADEERSSA